MMRTLVPGVLAALLAAPAFACSCWNRSPSPGAFLHLDSSHSISLPANARGVLFQKHADLDIKHSTEGVTILRSIPRGVTPGYFVMRDQTVNKPVTANYTPLDIDAQMGRAHTYYLDSRGKIPETASYGYEDDLHLVARKYGLRDVSVQMKLALGLLRVAPAGGFESGHTYSLNVRGPAGKSAQSALIRVGPPLQAGGAVAITRAGAPIVELTTVEGDSMCSEKLPAIKQQIAYLVPTERQPYRRMLMTFTFERNASVKGAQPFRETRYREHHCGIGELGLSDAGRGKELILALCALPGQPAETRLVRGYAGILELDETLHQTATLSVLFDQASQARCWKMQQRDSH